MELKSIKDAFDRVANKQKLSYTKTHEIIQMLSQELDKALILLQEQFDHRPILASLKKTLQENSPIVNQLEVTEKELNMALTKYLKSSRSSSAPTYQRLTDTTSSSTHTS